MLVPLVELDSDTAAGSQPNKQLVRSSIAAQQKPISYYKDAVLQLFADMLK